MYGNVSMTPDLDRDGDVDFRDFAVFAGYWLGTNDGADFTGNGLVGIDDLQMLAETWLEGASL